MGGRGPVARRLVEGIVAAQGYETYRSPEGPGKVLSSHAFLLTDLICGRSPADGAPHRGAHARHHRLAPGRGGGSGRGASLLWNRSASDRLGCCCPQRTSLRLVGGRPATRGGFVAEDAADPRPQRSWR